MKHTYKLIKTFMVLAVLGTLKITAQNCIQPTQYPSGTIGIAQTGSTTVSTCNYGGEYAVTNFTTAGSGYTINATGGSGNYLTITDNSNNVLISGTPPLAVTIPSVGIYRIHVSTNSSCGTESACHTIIVARVLPPCVQPTQYPSGTIGITQTGTTTVSTCNYGGEYAVTNFTASGSYTIDATGGSGNYVTVTDNSNNLVLAGFPPLAVTIPSVGIYRIHISTNISCGTESACHTILVIGIPPPSVANDLCTGAIALAVPSSTAGTTIGATVESPAPPTCVTTLNQPGVWYTVVGNGNRFGADLCAASGWDSKIFVYRGSCGSWTCVTGNDDNGPLCAGAAASATWCSIPSVTYYILVTGYSSASAFTVALTQTVNPFTPTVAVSASNASVCLTSSAAITATGAGSYVWSTGATTASISVTPTASTIYTVVGTASLGCATDTKTISITTLANPTIGLSANSASNCPGGSFTVTPTGASTYSFNGLPSGTVITSSTATLSPIVNTTYTVFGTGTNGCRSLLVNSPTATVITLVSPTLIVSATPTAVCPGLTASLMVTGANNYTWTLPASNATMVTINPTATTVYTVSGTGTTVCNGIRTFTMPVFPTPTISVNSNTVCSGSTFTMLPTGASTYTFSNGSNTIVPTTNTVVNVTGTSTNGCLSATAGVSSITVVTLPVISVNSGTVCEGSSFVFLPTGASNYTFVNSSNPVTPTISSSYTVVGNTPSVSSCVSLPVISNVTVFSLPSISVAATPTDMVICNTSPLVLSASGAVSYLWNNTLAGSNFTGTPSSSGSYFVVGTDANGCINFASVPYTVNPQPPVSITGSTFACLGSSYTLTANGAASYSWAALQSTANTVVVSPTVSNVYSVVGTNTLGCSKTQTFAVQLNSIVLVVSSNTAICQGNSTNVSAVGAVNYTWAPVTSPFGSVPVTPSVTTTYSYNAIDSKQCRHTGVITVSVNANPVVTASGSSTLICRGESATITANGANTYAWTAPTNTTGSSIVVNPSTNSTYMVTGTDNNGCFSNGSFALQVDPCTGLNKLANEISGLSIYPNPNNGEFTVELNNGLSKTIEVIDLTGRIILTNQTESDVMVVNLNNFANGVYYVKIQSANSVEVVKVIKH